MGTELQYTAAYVQPYEAVDIEAAQRGRPHFCFGCHREMVIKQGRKKRWHFAHKAGDGKCETDKTLHEAAKAFICQGFRVRLPQEPSTTSDTRARSATEVPSA